MDEPLDIGHGVLIAWMSDGASGIFWKHPGCRPWYHLLFRPDYRSTGHELVAGSRDDMAALTIGGSLLCPRGCGFHGEIKNGRWHPC